MMPMPSLRTAGDGDTIHEWFDISLTPIQHPRIIPLYLRDRSGFAVDLIDGSDGIMIRPTPEHRCCDGSCSTKCLLVTLILTSLICAAAAIAAFVIILVVYPPPSSTTSALRGNVTGTVHPVLFSPTPTPDDRYLYQEDRTHTNDDVDFVQLRHAGKKMSTKKTTLQSESSDNFPQTHLANNSLNSSVVTRNTSLDPVRFNKDLNGTSTNAVGVNNTTLQTESSLLMNRTTFHTDLSENSLHDNKPSLKLSEFNRTILPSSTSTNASKANPQIVSTVTNLNLTSFLSDSPANNTRFNTATGNTGIPENLSRNITRPSKDLVTESQTSADITKTTTVTNKSNFIVPVNQITKPFVKLDKLTTTPKVDIAASKKILNEVIDKNQRNK